MAKGRYILAAASVTAHTAESELLSIKMRVMAEGQPGYTTDFSSGQFLLVVNEDPLRPERFFSEQIRFGESMERELHFLITPAMNHVELRIHVGVDSHAEIPLDLASHQN